MFELKGKYGTAIVFTDLADDKSISQVKCEGVQTNLTKRRKEPEPQYLRGKMRFV